MYTNNIYNIYSYKPYLYGGGVYIYTQVCYVVIYNTTI